MLINDIKKKLSKAYTVIATVIIVSILFILQFVVLEGNIYFYKSLSFWMDLAVMIMILILANEVYWKSGSKKAEYNDKYISSAIEYSVRISKIKNNNPSLTDDFYKYIDEKNMEIFVEARNSFLEKNEIRKEEYYTGHILDSKDPDKRSEPHCNLSKSRLKSLTKETILGVEPYYTKKQIRAILKAVRGKFHYEELNATEILSGVRFKNNKYATSYNAHKNKTIFALFNSGTTFIIAAVGALLSSSLSDGWTLAALFTFLYRLLMLVWRAVVSYDAGYNDIAVIKRGVNLNRSNIITMYTSSRNLNNLFETINEDIVASKTQYLKDIGES